MAPETAHTFDKFRELLVYLWQIGANDPHLGAVKLNKLLYFADKEAYLTLGASITDASYQHLPEGPAPRAVLPVNEKLVKQGRLRQDPRPVGAWTQNRMEVLAPADLSGFAPAELAVVHDVVTRYWYLTGSEMSLLSHGDWGWRLTENGEDIPLRTAWLAAEDLSLEQASFGQALWQTLNARLASV
jgi:hypothetical protein